MDWNYILFLPAAVAVSWSLATMVLKRGQTHAQLLLCLAQLMVGFAIVMQAVSACGGAGSLFIYDYLFELSAMMAGPVYFMSICSLTEPRGATLGQRRIFVVPLLFVVGLTVGAFWLGPRRYELMCRDIGAGTLQMADGDAAWRFMCFWDHILFPVLLLAMDLVLIAVGTGKARRFQLRFNSFYAHNLEAPRIGIGGLVALTWSFLPIGGLMVFAIDFRPPHYPYWIVGGALLMTAVLYLIGRFGWRMKYDAGSLARYIRIKDHLQ